MTIIEIMELGRVYDFEGTYNNGMGHYKFRDGKMEVFSQILQEWIKATVSSAWLNHIFTVTNVTKAELN